MTMTLEQLEEAVLALPADSQAALLGRLLKRLGEKDEIDEEVATVWVEEAERRDREMDNGNTPGIPAEEVFEKLRASLK